MTGRPWSLRVRLLVGQVLLLALVAAGVGVTTELALRHYLMQQLDRELVEASHRSVIAVGGGPQVPPPPRGSPPLPHQGKSDGPGPDFLSAPGRAPGTVAAVVNDGRAATAGRLGADGTQTALSDAARRALAGVSSDGGPQMATIDGARYRVVGESTWSGDTVVTGLPMANVDAVVTRALAVALAATVAAVLLALLAGIWLIRRALAPLDRVAATAGRVADLRLDRGEVVLPVRVPAADADPRTEVGQLGAAVNRMLDHIAGALSARHDSETRVRQFVADASHELRTPLSAIRGYAELAQRAELPEPVAHAMGRVSSEAVRMTGLVDDLLLLARLDSGRPLDREPVDLLPLTVDAVSDAHIAGPDHAWRLDLPDHPVMVTGDAARLHQVLANLLANARTHTPPGTAVTVALATDDTGAALWRVTDTGPGIPPELLPDIFHRFTRGDTSRSRRAGSTGLGLAIADAVTHAHNGTITARSAPGDTTFTVRLPQVGVGEWLPVIYHR